MPPAWDTATWTFPCRTPPPPSSRISWHVEAEEEQEPRRARISIPWLGIAAFACVFAAIGLWIAA